METGVHSDTQGTFVKIPAGRVILEGDLVIPPSAIGIVLFAHGSGSSRRSRRNRAVAHTLRDGGLATLLFDLLTAEEEAEDATTARLRFDIALLAGRLGHATDWIAHFQDTNQLCIGYFGASTGAAAALVAAAEHPELVAAIVSRGGRPDLAGGALRRVRAPTLLVVGGNDTHVLDLNFAALAELSSEKRLEIIPGATHLFEESGALEQVAQLARDWFAHYLTIAPDHPTYYADSMGPPDGP
jgi:putative phosphoribosyl transferase